MATIEETQQPPNAGVATRPPHGRHHISCLRAMLAGIGLVCAVAFGSSPAQASEQATFTFDATLSLTGNCATSTLDPVPDPGCPEGKHPSKQFVVPNGVAVDAYGDRYVSNRGGVQPGVEGSIDVFNAKGEYLTRIVDFNQPSGVAVDKEGNLYVAQREGGAPGLVRYAPVVYKPQAGEVQYGEPVTVGGAQQGVAVDPSDGHVFRTNDGEHGNIEEFSSAAEGNKPIGTIFSKVDELISPSWLAVDAAHDKLYATSLAYPPYQRTAPNHVVVKVFELGGSHALLATYDYSESPGAGQIISENPPEVPIAVDEESGRFFVGDLSLGEPAVYEYAQDGSYLSTLARSGMKPISGQLAVDNSATSPTHGYLFVPSGEEGLGHSLAFAPNRAKPPVVESVSFGSVGTGEATLRAMVNPEGEATRYRIEYLTQQTYLEDGFTQAALAGEAVLLGAGVAEAVPVSARVVGLSPGVEYHVRVVAVDEDGEDEGQTVFSTYTMPSLSGGCSNEASRTGAGGLLPDCRAYELVTPPDTHGRAGVGTGESGLFVPTAQVTPDGKTVSFTIQGGALPGLGGTGSLAGDQYVATRGKSGWVTAYRGPSAAEASSILPGSQSVDQGFSVWAANGPGSAWLEKSQTAYLRYPDGHSQVLGQGSLRSDDHVTPVFVGEDGRHVVFEGIVQLDESAPPSGTEAVYDRTINSETGEEHLYVVSLLPGEIKLAEKEVAGAEGVSSNGEGVAFTVGKVLYLRYRDRETFRIGENATFSGISEDGARVFYVQAGNLMVFDAGSGETTAFSSSGDVIPVSVSADGRSAYFVSPTAMAVEPNPVDALPVNGAENLYRSQEGTLAFVGTVAKLDIEGEFQGHNTVGLNLIAAGSSPALDSSRITPDGNVLLFESRADLTGYDPGGHTEVYRYDAQHNELSCLSCIPTLAAAEGGATLVTVNGEPYDSTVPVGKHDIVGNLRVDGRRAFFQSTEALVPADTDGVQDVYEWEDQGVGSCQQTGGCIYLISSGQSLSPNYLYSVSSSGADVFIEAPGTLTSEDPDEAPSIYDVREDGGFPPSERSGECLGEACQPPVPTAIDATPATWIFSDEPASKPNCQTEAAHPDKCVSVRVAKQTKPAAKHKKKGCGGRKTRKGGKKCHVQARKKGGGR